MGAAQMLGKWKDGKVETADIQFSVTPTAWQSPTVTPFVPAWNLPATLPPKRLMQFYGRTQLPLSARDLPSKSTTSHRG